MLLQGQHRKLKQTVLQLFRLSQSIEYLPLVEMAAHDPDPRIQEYARKTFEMLTGNITA
jgi:hypothetical protein